MPPDLTVSLYTAEQARRIDRMAIDHCGIPAFDLMQRAADAVYATLRRRWPEARRIAVLAGQGNNGGDALLVARLALEQGLDVDVFAADNDALDDVAQSGSGENGDTKRAAAKGGAKHHAAKRGAAKSRAINRDAVKTDLPKNHVGKAAAKDYAVRREVAKNDTVHRDAAKNDAVNRDAEKSDAAKARIAFTKAGGRITPFRAADFSDADVIVDGLFGTGLSRAIEGDVAALIGRVNDSNIPVLAIDIPSGLSADTGMRLGIAIRAQATVSLIAWKRGLFTGDAADCVGTRELAPLDVPTTAFAGIEPDALLIGGTPTHALAPRRGNVNKANFGHVLAIGGDVGMGGAIRLASEAALRCGAGLVSVATRGEHVTALLAGRPELMAHAVDARKSLVALLARATVVAIGPGLGQKQWGVSLLRAALDTDLPLVVDADALNWLARHPRELANAVLTPHPGEAARLLGTDTKSVQADRFACARALARKYAAVVVLKGAGSLVAAPDGRVALCPWGNAGMASGGMGDVLTGVIAALRAQGLPAWDAACVGVGLHARAGDVAAGDMPRGLVASDLFGPLRELVNRSEA